jgi:hypothetical protein
VDTRQDWIGDHQQINLVLLWFVQQRMALVPRGAKGGVVVDLVKPRRWGLRPKVIERSYAEGKTYSDAATAAMKRRQREP